MKQLIILLLFALPVQLIAQDLQIDSLRALLEKEENDKERVDLYNKVAIYLYFDDAEQGKEFSQKAEEISNKISYQRGTDIARVNQLILEEFTSGFIPDSTKVFQIVQLTKKINHTLGLGVGYFRLAQFLWSKFKYQGNEAELYFLKAFEIFQKQQWPTGMGYVYEQLGNFKRRFAQKQALDYLDKAEAIAENVQNRRLSSQIFIDKGNIAREDNSNYPEAFQNYLQAIREAQVFDNKLQLFQAYENIGNIYRDIKDYDKALEYYQKVRQLYVGIDSTSFGFGFLFVDIGEIYANKGDTSRALEYFQRSLTIAEAAGIDWLVLYAKSWISLYGNGTNYPLIIHQLNDRIMAFEKDGYGYNAAQFLIKLASVYIQNKHYNEAQVALSKSEIIAPNAKDLKIYLHETRYELYKHTGKYKEALESFEQYQIARSEIVGRQKATELAALSFQNQINQQEQENQKLKEINNLNASKLKQRNIIINISIAGVLLLIALAFILWRNNRDKKRTNQRLAIQRDKISATLTDLRSTQSQLIQSEKMASLGELTAGIAHEIQNPLNFVNNFSEVNKEMLAELNEEIDKGNYDDAKSIAKDVIANEQKINHHGKRAGAIVKGMLQHSQKSSGQKEPTDINALCDEYLTLSYHGLRAKDKSFDSDIKTDFDDSIGNINVVPQDIGRVLLNLFNNAFYAINEKKKACQAELVEANYGYQPSVSIQTKKINDKIEIRIIDNGNGIPQNMVDKIFQPFFTTKPTGQGTGLGLSLSYDIIKAHGGEIKVETKEGDYSEFIFSLPLQSI